MSTSCRLVNKFFIVEELQAATSVKNMYESGREFSEQDRKILHKPDLALIRGESLEELGNVILNTVINAVNVEAALEIYVDNEVLVVGSKFDSKVVFPLVVDNKTFGHLYLATLGGGRI